MVDGDGGRGASVGRPIDLFRRVGWPTRASDKPPTAHRSGRCVPWTDRREPLEGWPCRSQATIQVYGNRGRRRRSSSPRQLGTAHPLNASGGRRAPALAAGVTRERTQTSAGQCAGDESRPGIDGIKTTTNTKMQPAWNAVHLARPRWNDSTEPTGRNAGPGKTRTRCPVCRPAYCRPWRVWCKERYQASY